MSSDKDPATDCHTDTNELEATSDLTDSLENLDLQNRLHLGAHIEIEETLVSTVNTGIGYGLSNLQIFLGNPRSSGERRVVSKEDSDAVKKMCKSEGVKIFAHAPMTCLPSGYLDGRPFKMQRILAQELLTLSKFSGKSVCHIGFAKDNSRGLKTVVNNVKEVFSLLPNNSNNDYNGILLLENSGQKGNSLGRTFEELYEIYSLTNSEKLGFCIDTQHLWSNGAELNTEPGIAELLQNLNCIPVGLIHLNDSKVSMNSGKDRHGNLGELIWAETTQPLKTLLTAFETMSIPFVLETPDPIECLNTINTMMG